MRFSYKVIPVAVSLALALSGCSGGSGAPSPTPSPSPSPTPTPPPPPPPPAPTPLNTAPVAMDDVVSTNNAVKVTIAVLENDTDVDGDILTVDSILISPQNGSATIEGTTIIYTPNDKFIGEDLLSYEISDGKLTAEARVTIHNSQTITLNGAVSGTELLSGKVVATVNGEVSESTTNSDGSYSLNINLTSTLGSILLRAQGAENGDQSQATLMSLIGTTDAIFDAVDANNHVDASMVSGLNVNQLTTARFLLADSVNSQNLSVNDEGFAALLTDLNATDLIELAAFIKLIINNNSYSLPVAQTTESLFTTSVNETPGLTIREFLTDNGLINSEGNQSTTYTQDLAEAITTTVEQFKQPIDAQPVGGREDATFVGDLRQGYLPGSADLYEFDGETTGVYWRSTFFEANKFPFEWNTNNGDLVISYTTGVSFAISSSISYSPSVVEKFGTEAQQKAAEIAAAGGFPFGLVTITKQPSEDRVKIIAIDKSRDQIFRERTELEILILNDGSQEFTYPFESQSFVSENKVSTKHSLLSSDAEVLGDWVIHLDYIFSIDNESVNNTQSKLSGDIVSFTTDANAAGQHSAKTFVWSLDNSQNLLLNDGTSSLVITPFLANDDGMVATFTEYVDNIVVTRYIREFYKVEQTNVTLASLQTNLPEVYVAMFNATQPNAWDTGLLNINYVAGHNFKANDTVDRLEGAFETSSSGSGPYFDYSWLNRMAVQTDNSLKFVEENDSTSAQRTWQLIKTNSAGRIWVLESFVNIQNNDSSQIVVVGPPRINSIVKTDLSQYQDAWSRTIEKGIVSP